MIDRIVVMGDSLSDPGNKQHTASGRLARAINEMRVNETGRFSDTRNWTDFIWEWSGGDSLIHENSKQTQELTRMHRSLENSNHGSPDENFSYVNYAVGGAVTKKSTNLARRLGLTTLNEQKKQYFDELEKESRAGLKKPDDTLHIIWTGLNDTVTDAKEPEEMEAIVNKIKQITDEIRMRVEQDGGKAQFMLVNNPDPQQAVRFAKDPNDKKVVKAKIATEEFNRLLRQEFPDKYDDTVLVDMYDMINQSNLYKLRLIKAKQNHGEQVEYETPYRMDTSLGNALREFGEMHQGTPEGQKIFSEIKPFLDRALETDDEITLHKQVGNLILQRMEKGDVSNEVIAIRDALMVTGTYPSQLDFATQYYQVMHNSQKHDEDIDKIQEKLNNIFAQQVSTQLSDDLNALNEDLYDTVADTLLKSKSNSTYRNLIAGVTANNFGFVSTSDGVHPTQALHQVIALNIARTMMENFSQTPGENFEENTKRAFGNTKIFRTDNPLASLNDPLPSRGQVDINKFIKATVRLNSEVKENPAQESKNKAYNVDQRKVRL